MPKLENYRHFDGRHWETGTVRNFYAYRGVTAPHTGAPYTEAMLLGISGGVVMGYFSFAYEGYDPQARVLTRNTFDPLDTLLERLGVVQNILHTSSPDTGVRNLCDTLESGLPAIVWADFFSLPYNALPDSGGMWAMFPIIVYGYDATAGTAWIADRARVPITVTTGALDAARARVKKVKFRVLTLEPPNPDKLAAAVQKGIWDCIKLFTEAPPKGSKNNFGLAAFRWWADLLNKPKQRLSWEKVFPAGAKMYAGLTWAFTDIQLFGKGEDGNAERGLYADFLDEAAVVLDRPALREAARQFRASAQAWGALATALLPDDAPPLAETRALLLRRHRLFLDTGGGALPEMQAIDARLDALRAEVAADFPLSAAEVTAMRENLRAHIMRIHDLEKEAVAALQAAMA